MWGELGFAWLLLVALGTHGGWWLHGRSGQTRGLTHRGLVVHPTFLLLLALTHTGAESGWEGSLGMQWGGGLSL